MEVIVKSVVWLAMIVPDELLTVVVRLYVPVHAAGGTVSESVKRRVL